MQTIDTNFDLDAFLQTVPEAPARILLLDYDGTLAPFRVERHQAVPYPGVRDILNDILSTKRTRLVIVSGRSIRDLIPLLGLAKLPELYGSHGAEYLAVDRKYHRRELSAKVAEGLLQVAEWAQKNDLAGVIEKKPCGLAIHWRGLSRARSSEIENDVHSHWEEKATEFGLELHRFDGGVEFRPEGMHKGNVVNRVFTDAVEGAVAAYLGDDLTDEDAFRAMRGRGVSVLVGETVRKTSADVRITPPDQLLGFLRRWV